MKAAAALREMNLRHTRPIIRVGLVVVTIACLAAFWNDPAFPMVAGIMLLVLCWLGWETYFLLPKHSFSLFFLHALFLLTYPLYLAHLVFDKEFTHLEFDYTRQSYEDVVIAVMAGYAGILAAQLVMLFSHTRSRLLPPFRVDAILGKVKPAVVIPASVAMYIISLAVIYNTGVGVVGYVARPDIGFIYGFTARLNQVVVPMVNLFVIEMFLLQGNHKALKRFMPLVVIETLMLILVSLSRYPLISYILLPALLIWFYQARNVSRKQMTRILVLVLGIIAVVTVGISAADMARKVIFQSLIAGSGYEGLSGADEFDWPVLLGPTIINAFAFFERLGGMREFIWVHVAIGSNTAISDVWHSLIVGPPAEDPYYIIMRVLGIVEAINEDTGFGSGLTLFANLRVAGEYGVLFVGMLIMTFLFVALEAFVRGTVRYHSLVLFFVMIVVVNLWQGLAFTTVFQRPVQMVIIGMGMLVTLGLKWTKYLAPAPEARS